MTSVMSDDPRQLAIIGDVFCDPALSLQEMVDVLRVDPEDHGFAQDVEQPSAHALDGRLCIRAIEEEPEVRAEFGARTPEPCETGEGL